MIGATIASFFIAHLFAYYLMRDSDKLLPHYAFSICALIPVVSQFMCVGLLVAVINRYLNGR